VIRRWTKGWIGIDLGARAVKLAQVERLGSQLRLVHSRVIKRRETPGEDAGASLAGWWDELCRTADLRSGFSGRGAACILPEAKTDLRAMNVPDGPEADRRAIIANELATIGAGNVEGRSFDYWNSRPPVEGGQSQLENVNVLSVADEDAQTLCAGLSRAGLACYVLDGLPLALCRAVKIVAGGGGAPVAALDWGYHSAAFSVICGGRPVFTRHLRDCGFAALPEAMVKAMALSTNDVEQLLVTSGICDPQGNDDDPQRDVQEIVADVVGEAIHRVVLELQKTLSYAELQRSHVIPEKIWVFGAGATVRNMAAFLAAQVGVPVQAWSLPAAGGGQWGRSAPPWELLGPAVALSSLAWVS
jgi:Tfp pilus assembly PilM family ATPase